MTTTVAGEAYQADWIEHDDAGRPVLCVTNTVTIVNRHSVSLLGGAQDQPEVPESSVLADVFLDLPVRFEPRKRPEIEAFEREHVAFQSLLPRLEVTHGGRFVAVHRGAVVDADSRREELVRRFFARFGDVPVYVGYVGEPPIAYQVTPFQI
ncbi:MAG: hypothetical protein ACREA0_07540 [bacterium]